MWRFARFHRVSREQLADRMACSSHALCRGPPAYTTRPATPFPNACAMYTSIQIARLASTSALIAPRRKADKSPKLAKRLASLPVLTQTATQTHAHRQTWQAKRTAICTARSEQALLGARQRRVPARRAEQIGRGGRSDELVGGRVHVECGQE